MDCSDWSSFAQCTSPGDRVNRWSQVWHHVAATLDFALREPEVALPLLTWPDNSVDPNDEVLQSLLPFFRRWSDARKLVQPGDPCLLLDVQCRKLGNRHVQRLLNHWEHDRDLTTPEISFDD